MTQLATSWWELGPPSPIQSGRPAPRDPAGRRPLARALGAVRRFGSAVALLAAGALPARAQTPAPTATPQPASRAATTRAPRPISLADAITLGVRQSENVRIAEAGVLRARGQFTQARSQLFPQLNATGAYQKQLQNQFQALQEQASRNAPPPPTGPTFEALCAPNVPAGATAEQRAAALAQAQSCQQAGGGDGLGSITRVFANPNNIILGLSGSQTLFAGGRITAGTRAAEAGRRAAEIGLTSARAQVTLDVAQAYLDAALADRLVAINESTLVQTERAFRQTAIGFQVGTISEFDLLRARVARDNQRPVLIQTRTQRDVAYARLRQLLDLPLDEPLALTTTLPAAVDVQPLPAAGQRSADASVAPRAGATSGTGTPADGAGAAPRTGSRAGAPTRAVAATYTTVEVDPAEVLADDPAVQGSVDSLLAAADTSARDRAPVRQTRENVAAQRSLLRVTRAQRLPAVQLSTNYQRFAYPAGNGVTLPTALNQFFPNWTVTLGVSVPLLTGGRIRGETLVAEANLREAEQQARQVEELSALDAQLAVAQLRQAEAAWRASAGTATQAARAYTIAEVRFREGLATQVELSDTRLLLQQAEANAAQAARDREVAQLRLTLLRDLPLAQLQQQGAQGGQFGGAQGGAAGRTQQGGGTQQQQPRGQQPSQQGAGGFQQAGSFGGGTP